MSFAPHLQAKIHGKVRESGRRHNSMCINLSSVKFEPFVLILLMTSQGHYIGRLARSFFLVAVRNNAAVPGERRIIAIHSGGPT